VNIFVTVWFGFVMMKFTALHCCRHVDDEQNSRSMNRQLRVIESVDLMDKQMKMILSSDFVANL